MRRGRRGSALLALGLLFASAGCASYYRVADPQTSKVYYTTSVRKSGRAGYVEFKDAKTGAKVTLQSSEVAEISKYEFDRGTK